MNITKEQIEKIASQEIDIKDLFPEVFKFTGWAKDKKHKEWLGYYENNILKYGFSTIGIWFTWKLSSKYNPNKEHPATHEEIKTALVNEAKERGFVIGCKHTITNSNGEVIAYSERFGFNETCNKLLFNNWCIFQNGTWAEVKKEPKYVLVDEEYLYLICIGISKGDFISESNTDKDFAIIFDTKEKAEAMNVLLNNKYKLEEL